MTPTAPTSPPAPALLLLRQLDRAEERDLVLQVDTVLHAGAAARLRHERDRVGRPSAAGVLDEVRVPRRDLRPADPVAPETAGFEHSAGGELVIRILEDASEGPLVRRLGCLPPRLHVGDRRLDLLGRPPIEAELDPRDDLSVRDRGVAVREVELVRAPPLGAASVDHECTDEDLRRYQLHCVDRGVSPITLNAAITGLKFLFEVTLKRPEVMSKHQRGRLCGRCSLALRSQLEPANQTGHDQASTHSH